MKSWLKFQEQKFFLVNAILYFLNSTIIEFNLDLDVIELFVF